MTKRKIPKTKKVPLDPPSKGGRALERLKQDKKKRGLPDFDIDATEGTLIIDSEPEETGEQ